jgi:hypothetical protein
MAKQKDDTKVGKDTSKAVDNIKANSICVLIKLRRVTVRRTVPQTDVSVEATEETGRKSRGDVIDQDLVTVAKDLLDSSELRKITTFDHVTKLWVKSKTVQSPLLRSSAYLLSVDSLPEMYAFLEQRKKDRGPLIAEFKAALPELIADARKRLGPIFDPAQYPLPEAVDKLFDMSWYVIEIVTPNEKLRTISQALFEREKAKAEAVWTSAVGQINDALAEGMAEVVAHLGARLGGGDEPPKRFRETAIKKVTDFLDAFGQRNVTGNADLARLVDQARKLLSGVDAKAVKKDGDLRKRLAQGVAEIKGSLDGMLENRPARAAAAFTDDAV